MIINRSQAPRGGLLGSVAAISAILSLGAAAQAQEQSDYPFARFVGEWTLKDDQFSHSDQNGVVVTETIPNHHTACQPINTSASVLCVVTAGDLRGHILWVFDADAGKVRHLSHFGTRRAGVGEGALNARGDLRSVVRFQDEPEGSYRIYEYTWLSADEYDMSSTQFGADNQPTGNWYGGRFVRITAP